MRTMLSALWINLYFHTENPAFQGGKMPSGIQEETEANVIWFHDINYFPELYTVV
jgi:hypothetical protein